MNMKSLGRVMLAMAAGAVMSGCASTQIISEWRNPETGGTGPYAKVFLAAISKQEPVRRQLEDTFLATLKPLGTEVVPSYTALAAAGEVNKDQLTAAVKASGADAALVIRMVQKETKTTISAGYASGPTDFYGSYHSAWIGYYEPPMVYEYDVVTVEARLFDVKLGKLVWAVSTETTDPGKLPKELSAYAKLITQHLQKAGFLAGQP